MAKNERLRVVITGNQNSGKTTVLRVIEDALRRAGFADVKVLDDGLTKPKGGLNPLDSRNVRRFAEGRSIDLVSVTTRRLRATQPKSRQRTAKQGLGEAFGAPMEGVAVAKACEGGGCPIE